MYNYSVTEDDLATAVKEADGSLYSPDGSRLLKSQVDTEIVIKDGTKIICDRAIQACNGVIRKIQLPDSVEAIGACAFSNNSNLETINLPGSLVAIAENNPFGGCISLKNVFNDSPNFVIRDNSLYSSDFSTFYGVIPGGVESIDCQLDERVRIVCKNAFWGCENLGKVVIPIGVTEIATCTFKNAKAKEIIIHGRIEYIQDSSFAGIKADRVVFLSDVINISSKAFFLANIKDGLILPNSVQTIGETAFSMCKGLSRLPHLNELKFLGERAFSYSDITYFCFSSGLNTIPESCFAQCQGLSKLQIPLSISRIEDCAFNMCENLTEVKISSEIQFIGDSVFCGCDRVKIITENPDKLNKSIHCNIQCSGCLNKMIVPQDDELTRWLTECETCCRHIIEIFKNTPESSETFKPYFEKLFRLIPINNWIGERLSRNNYELGIGFAILSRSLKNESSRKEQFALLSLYELCIALNKSGVLNDEEHAALYGTDIKDIYAWLSFILSSNYQLLSDIFASGFENLDSSEYQRLITEYFCTKCLYFAQETQQLKSAYKLGPDLNEFLYFRSTFLAHNGSQLPVFAIFKDQGARGYKYFSATVMNLAKKFQGKSFDLFASFENRADSIINQIRNRFRRIRNHNTDLQDISSLIAEYFRIAVYEDNLQTKNHLDYGISFTIMSMMENRPCKHVRLVHEALKQLLLGLDNYENKFYKGEAAYWLLFCIMYNIKHLRSLICSIIINNGEVVSETTLNKYTYSLCEEIFGYAVKVDFENNTFFPFFDEANGLNHEKYQEMRFGILNIGDNFSSDDFDEISRLNALQLFKLAVLQNSDLVEEDTFRPLSIQKIESFVINGGFARNFYMTSLSEWVLYTYLIERNERYKIGLAADSKPNINYLLSRALYDGICFAPIIERTTNDNLTTAYYKYRKSYGESIDLAYLVMTSSQELVSNDDMVIQNLFSQIEKLTPQMYSGQTIEDLDEADLQNFKSNLRIMFSLGESIYKSWNNGSSIQLQYVENILPANYLPIVNL